MIKKSCNDDDFLDDYKIKKNSDDKNINEYELLLIET